MIATLPYLLLAALDGQGFGKLLSALYDAEFSSLAKRDCGRSPL